MLDFELQIGLTPRQRHIYLALQKAGQRGLDIEELIEKVYSGEEDGGPLGGRTTPESWCTILNSKIYIRFWDLSDTQPAAVKDTLATR